MTDDMIRIPLLYDHHTHVSLYAALAGGLNLNRISSKSVAMEMLSALPKDAVSMVTGWNSGFYDFTQTELDNLPPLVIANLSLHGFKMNVLAMEPLSKPHEAVVANYKRQAWCESHFPEILAFYTSVQELTHDTLDLFWDELGQAGVFSADDMLLPSEKAWQTITQSPYRQRTGFWTTPDVFTRLSLEVQHSIKGLKFFTDGALGTRSAAMSSGFTTGETPNLLFSDEELKQRLLIGRQLCPGAAVHAIGDRATRQVVRVYDQLVSERTGFETIRIEHCQFIDRQTAVKAKELGIVLCMQPNFNTDSLDYTDRLLQTDLCLNNPFRMLIDQAGFIPGKDLIFGSDGMPHGAEYALKAALFPPYTNQKLTLDEFVKGYCINDPKLTNGHIRIENIQSEKAIRVAIKKGG